MLRLHVRKLADHVPATLTVSKIPQGFELAGDIDDLNDYLHANALRRELNYAKVIDTTYAIPTFN